MSETDTNWIKLSRKLLVNDLWKSEPFTKGQAWVDLLLLANHADGFFFNRGIQVNVTRGQVGYSELQLSIRWKWSRTKVKKFFELLEKEQQIVQHRNNVNTLITIVNYEVYQPKEQQKEQQKSNRNATEEQQKSTNKNEKNEEKKTITTMVDVEEGVPFHEKIGISYNKFCPSFQRVLDMGVSTRWMAAKRIQEKYKHHEGGAERFLDCLFRKAEASDTLTNRNGEWKGRPVNIDWLLKEENYIQVIEGRFDNDKPPSRGKPKRKQGFRGISDDDKKAFLGSDGEVAGDF